MGFGCCNGNGSTFTLSSIGVGEHRSYLQTQRSLQIETFLNLLFHRRTALHRLKEKL